MIKIHDNGTTNFYFDEFGMMLDRSDWNKHGVGDALWRTSLALIASGNIRLKASVHCQAMWNNNKVRFRRHPTDHDNDTSRDQSIMALVALKEHHKNAYELIRDHLDFRISKKFTWQDAWFWAKERYLIWRITSCYHFIGWWFEPSYSIHLFCWMVWSSGQKMPLIKWYLLNYIVPKTNYLCRALLGVKEEIPPLTPMDDFRWQRDTPWLQGSDLTPREAEYNTLDLDVLAYVTR